MVFHRFTFGWESQKKPRSSERGFFNDVCLTANDDADANDVASLIAYGKHRITASVTSNIILAKLMHHIAVRRCIVFKYLPPTLFGGIIKSKR